MKRILEFKEFFDRESKTRTKSVEEEEFLRIFRENCKDFSFENDLLWRKASNFGPFGLFFSADRIGTIGNYRYKEFFDDRKDYPVPRHKSLIGSTTPEGAEYFGSDSKIYMVIPFDGSNLVFACVPDIAALAKFSKEEFKDSHFLLRKYEAGFKAPNEELFSIMATTGMASSIGISVEKRLGFEFFTDANCLMIEMDRVEWLRSNI